VTGVVHGTERERVGKSEVSEWNVRQRERTVSLCLQEKSLYIILWISRPEHHDHNGCAENQGRARRARVYTVYTSCSPVRQVPFAPAEQGTLEASLEGTAPPGLQ
jgi:hypothetical protein